jgi:hypothetical protein
VIPSTRSPGFHTRPEPSARLRAYRIEIIASSKSVKPMRSPAGKAERAMNER